MFGTVRIRFWVEAALAVLAVAVLTLTLLWHDWIERAFGFEPDGGNGSLEWLIVVALVATTATTSLIARREWRRERMPAAA